MAAESVTRDGGLRGGAERQTGISGRRKRAPRTCKKFLLMATNGDVTYVTRV